MTERETQLIKTIECILVARQLMRQPMQVSGEYDPAKGKFGQGTAKLPDGTPVDRHQYMIAAMSAAEAMVRQYRPVPVLLTPDEIGLLSEALNSHEYWQLSDSDERNNGESLIEDGDNDEVDAVRELNAKLDAARAEALK